MDTISFCGKEVTYYQICPKTKKIILSYKDGTTEHAPIGQVGGLVKSEQPHSRTREEIVTKIECHTRILLELQYELDKLP